MLLPYCSKKNTEHIVVIETPDRSMDFISLGSTGRKECIIISQICYSKHMAVNKPWHCQKVNHTSEVSYTVIITLAFLYQLSSGFSPFFVCVSVTYAHLLIKSSWLESLVSLPVIARYTSSIMLKSVGKNMSKNP